MIELSVFHWNVIQRYGHVHLFSLHFESITGEILFSEDLTVVIEHFTPMDPVIAYPMHFDEGT